MAKRRAKVVTVRYGWMSNRPHNRNIERTIEKWVSKGYKLTDRQDKDVGCAGCLFSLGWSRGRTQLTFIQDEG